MTHVFSKVKCNLIAVKVNHLYARDINPFITESGNVRQTHFPLLPPHPLKVGHGTSASEAYGTVHKRHVNVGAPIKIACGTKTFMLHVTFIKAMGKEKEKRRRLEVEQTEMGNKEECERRRL